MFRCENVSVLSGVVSIIGFGAQIVTLILGLAGHLEAATFQTLISLPGSSDGASPTVPVIDVAGSLYGTTYYGGTDFSGTIFRLDPLNGHTSTVYSFTGHADGAGPTSLTSVGHVLYGATAVGSNFGGPQGYGTIFRIDPASGAETTLHSFSGGIDGDSANKLVVLDGQLYGSTWGGGTQNGGVIFSIDATTGNKTVIHNFGVANDGDHPIGDLFASGGNLYGSTLSGGPTGCGILFRLNGTNGEERVISSFPNTCGSSRGGAYARVGHVLYGINSSGLHNQGAVFEIDELTGEDQLLYSFTGGQDGANPTGGLVSSGGLLYGTTDSKIAVQGGSNIDRETIFSVDPINGTLNTIFIFADSNGVYPEGDFTGGALLSANGVLYGTCIGGGLTNEGTAFSFRPETNSFMVLHDFVGLANYNGNSGLIVSHANLYGTSQQGGKAALGSVFRINPQTGAMKSIYDFTGGGDGYAPNITTLFANGRSLYGATVGDNAATPHGTVFSIDTRTDALTTLNDFSGDPVTQDGPNSGVVELGGSLYGTTDSNGGNAGSIYRIPTSPSSAIKMTSLQNVGGDSIGGLTSYQGALYGTTFAIYGIGQVFKFDPKAFTVSTVYAFRGGNDGELPIAGVTAVNGQLYGTTLFGGSANAGTVFQVDPTTGVETILHTFTGGADGADAGNGLLAVGGTLYGTTGGGGANSNGTIFSIDIATGAYSILYSFVGGADGGFPSGPLVQFGSSLFGTTSLGGAENRGTVFRFTP